MISLDPFIALIQNNTIYTPVYSQSKSLVRRNEGDPHHISLAYQNLGLKYFRTSDKHDFVDYASQMKVQIFEVHINCRMSDLHLAHNRILQAMEGQSPYSVNQNASPIYHVEGSIAGYDQGSVWWVDNYAFEQPTMLYDALET